MARAWRPRSTNLAQCAVADPNMAVASRQDHPCHDHRSAAVELKLNDKTPPAVVAIDVFDSELDGGVGAVDTSGNKITLSDIASTGCEYRSEEHVSGRSRQSQSTTR